VSGNGAQTTPYKGDNKVKHKLMVVGGIAAVVIVVLILQRKGVLAKIPVFGQYLS
jgi:hypothetical protein